MGRISAAILTKAAWSVWLWQVLGSWEAGRGGDGF
jgi:hypothetical protein